MGEEIKFLWVILFEIDPEEVLLIFFLEVDLFPLGIDMDVSWVCMGGVKFSKSDSFCLHRLKWFHLWLIGVGFIVLEFLSIVFDDDEGVLIHINDKILVEWIKMYTLLIRKYEELIE